MLAGELSSSETVLSHRRRASELRLPPPEETDDFTTGERMAGNDRDCTALAGFACSTAELRTDFHLSGRLRTSDLTISEVTDLFTTALPGAAHRTI